MALAKSEFDDPKYPNKNVLLSDYSNPRYSIVEYRLFLSFLLNFKCESQYYSNEDEHIVTIWGTEKQQYQNLFESWLAKQKIGRTVSQFDDIVKIEGNQNIKVNKTKIVFYI